MMATATPAAPRDAPWSARIGRAAGAARARMPRVRRSPVEPAPAWVTVLSYSLSVLSALVLLILVNLILISPLQQFTAQGRLYSELRLGLAQGSLPVGQTDINGNLVAPGTPLGLVTIPALGINDVFVEGTASGQTMEAIGHRRDTVLPGQQGVSVLMGRQNSYGGTFGALDRLRPGDTLSVTTGQGSATFTVVDTRRGDEAAPTLAAGGSRIVLTTAYGAPYAPQGVLRVDADLVGSPFATPARAVISGSIPASEGVFGVDGSVLFALTWLLELLLIVVVVFIWSWRRWHRTITWLIFTPVLLAVSLGVADQVCHLLPNLL